VLLPKSIFVSWLKSFIHIRYHSFRSLLYLHTHTFTKLFYFGWIDFSLCIKACCTWMAGKYIKLHIIRCVDITSPYYKHRPCDDALKEITLSMTKHLMWRPFQIHETCVLCHIDKSRWLKYCRSMQSTIQWNILVGNF